MEHDSIVVPSAGPKIPATVDGAARDILPADAVSQSLIPDRGMRRGLGLSALLHVVLLLTLSLIVIHQNQPPATLLAEVRFEEQLGTGQNLQLTPELQTPVSAEMASVFENLEVVTTAGGLTSTSDLKMDFSPFSSTPGSTPTNAVSAAVTEIQDRVQKAGGKTGEIQFSLAWQSFNDLDLHVIAPSGEHICYRQKASRCRGLLDVDMNAEPTTDAAVENIRWLNRNAPMGRFTVLVHQYQWRSGKSVDDFQLLVNLGEQQEVIEGRVRAGAPVSVHRFQYIKTSLPENRRRELSEELSRLQEREEKQASQMLEKALPMDPGKQRDQQMAKIIFQFPHTNASLRAMQELAAEPK